MNVDAKNASGLAGYSSLYYLSQHTQNGFIFLPDHLSLSEAKLCLSFFCPKKRVFVYPEFTTGYDPIREDPEIYYDRINTQMQLATLSGRQKEDVYILSTPIGASQICLSPKQVLSMIVSLKKSDLKDRDELIQELKAGGYLQDELAQDRGLFSVRGHLVDIFSPYDDQPIRVEFFGDEIVSLRRFDPESQRSLDELQELEIAPCREINLSSKNLENIRKNLKDLGDSQGINRDDREHLFWQLSNQREVMQTRLLLPASAGETGSIFDYLPESFPSIAIDEEDLTSRYTRALEQEQREFSEKSRLAYGPDILHRSPLSKVEKADLKLSTKLTGTELNYNVLTHENLRTSLKTSKSFKPLKDLILDLKLKDHNICVLFKNEKKMAAVKESLEEVSSQVEWIKAEIFPGFSSKTFRKAFITEQDIFGIQKKRSSLFRQASAKDFLREFSNLAEGDFVVHEDHGVGQFKGLVKLSLSEVESEFVLLEYLEGDKLYLPIYRIDQISRYVGGDEISKPRLDKLGSQVFSKKRKKAREDILKIAHELMEIAAKRRLEKIERPFVDESMYQTFCSGFPYDLTVDQEKAIQDVESDLTKPNPMDRLVCGDVGFGKTEVAMRATMLRLLQNRQVAVLAPTTLLVEQHFKGFKKRLSGLPFRVERLSRFQKSSEQKRIIADMKEGKVDLVIGTHRLLQRDIGFKSLGLLVVDEEQRFGVKHKEKIKKLRGGIDILTLSATPIPRTLQMSIVGIRDLSLIVSPPETREQIETKIGNFDSKMIQDVSKRELDRGGQVLFVHNRVKTIYKVAEKLREILPDCKILIGHGQMPEDELEEVMLSFMDQKADLLLATSIIENGIDIPNANTLFVDHAEHFGLSDLYQLRGRVGRSNRKAYAHFLIHPNQPLSLEASKRLQVIQNCTELGSGFKVAAHDLEIRGSGNLLGESQSGVVAEVGLELYNHMLHESLAELRNEEREVKLPELNSGYTAFIPEHYIADIPVRISTYRRLDRASGLPELLQLEDELLDRFGLYPAPVDQLCQLIRLRIYAAHLRAKSIDCYPGRLSLELTADTPLDPSKLVARIGKDISVDPSGKISFSFESAMKDAEKIRSTKFETPEQFDFAQCRNFLNDLCKAAGIENL